MGKSKTDAVVQLTKIDALCEQKEFILMAVADCVEFDGEKYKFDRWMKKPL